MNAKLWIAAGLAFVPVVSGAAPGMDDYARGIEVLSPADRPLVQISLPDEVYQSITRADLGDLRVFNSEGRPVPHALCVAPGSSPPTLTEVPLAVFELRQAGTVLHPQTRVDVQTSGGTRMQVEESGREGRTLESGRTHIIDARPAEGPIRAIVFDWLSPDGASEARVRIESSPDLDEWSVLVPQTTLLLVRQDGRELRRERIELPQREYTFLRVARTDQGPPLVIEAARGERVLPAAEAEPFRFDASAVASSDPATLDFDAGRLAPITYARLHLPEDNSAVRISIQSRADERSSWRTHWTGETYRYVTGSNVRESAPARFAPTTHRYWRVQSVDDTPISPGARLELGYHPAKLRFLSQGTQPFVLAFGSVRADPANAVACEHLLQDVSAEERQALIAEGELGSPRELAGEEAFRPLPRKTPVRVIVLWSVLIAGVALVVGMALTLLKRVRERQAP